MSWLRFLMCGHTPLWDTGSMEMNQFSYFHWLTIAPVNERNVWPHPICGILSAVLNGDKPVYWLMIAPVNERNGFAELIYHYNTAIEYIFSTSWDVQRKLFFPYAHCTSIPQLGVTQWSSSTNENRLSSPTLHK